jgi:hypothetical protein
MTKYQDFSGDISVDFELEHCPLKEKLEELTDLNFRDDDIIIGIEFSSGEYHHKHHKSKIYDQSLFLTIKVTDSINLKKRKFIEKPKQKIL